MPIRETGLGNSPRSVYSLNFTQNFEFMHRFAYILFFILAANLFQSCSQGEPNTFTIRGTAISDIEDGTQVFLNYRDSIGNIQVKDSTILESNAFTFKGIAEDEGLNFIQIDGQQGGILLFVEPGEIVTRFQKDSLQFAKVEGTPQNEILTEYLETQREMAQAKEGIQNDWREAVQSQDTIAMGSLRGEFEDLMKKEAQDQKKFIMEHPDARVSAFIFGDLLNQQMLTNEEILEAYEALSPEIKETSQARKMKEILDKRISTDIGSVAPPITGPDPDGNTVALEDLRGKLVLVDFWAAWCRPCRVENPNIVSVYNKYKDDGFTVLGVSLDKDSGQWKKAIEDDGLTWNHLSNLMGFQDPIALEYDVKGIPASFLVDSEGVIIAKNLRGPDLEVKVAEVLGSE